jgi:hypothetical protein
LHTKFTCVRQCCNYQNPKVVGYVVAVSFVELSTLVYPISKSGPTQTSVLVKSQCHAQCVRDKLAPPPSVAFSLIKVLLQPTTALTAAHNNFDAAYCRPYCSLLA